MELKTTSKHGGAEYPSLINVQHVESVVVSGHTNGYMAIYCVTFVSGKEIYTFDKRVQMLDKENENGN